MAEVGELSDHQLRENLQQLGFTPGPCTNTTRPVLERKLRRLSSDQVGSSTLASNHVSNDGAAAVQLPDNGHSSEAGMKWFFWGGGGGLRDHF